MGEWTERNTEGKKKKLRLKEGDKTENPMHTR